MTKEDKILLISFGFLVLGLSFVIATIAFAESVNEVFPYSSSSGVLSVPITSGDVIFFEATCNTAFEADNQYFDLKWSFDTGATTTKRIMVNGVYGEDGSVGVSGLIPYTNTSYSTLHLKLNETNVGCEAYKYLTASIYRIVDVQTGGGSSSGDALVASSTEAAQNQQNLFNAVVIFFLSTGFVVWLFRK